MSEIDNTNTQKPWALYLLAECHQQQSNEEPSIAVSCYREAIDLLLEERQNSPLPNRPSNHEIDESLNQNQNVNLAEERSDIAGLIPEDGLVHKDGSSPNRSSDRQCDELLSPNPNLNIEPSEVSSNIDGLISDDGLVSQDGLPLNRSSDHQCDELLNPNIDPAEGSIIGLILEDNSVIDSSGNNLSVER